MATNEGVEGSVPKTREEQVAHFVQRVETAFSSPLWLNAAVLLLMVVTAVTMAQLVNVTERTIAFASLVALAMVWPHEKKK